LKRTIVTTLKFAISIGILSFLFWKEMRNDQFGVLLEGDKNWGLLCCGIGCTFLAIMTGLFRWKLLVNGIRVPFRYRDAVKIGFMGQFFNLLAFGMLGGDALRAYYLCRIYHKRRSEMIATVIGDRLIGMLTMFGIGTLAFWAFDVVSLVDQDEAMVPVMQLFGWIISLVTLMGLLLGVGLLLFPEFHQWKILQAIFRIPRIGPGLAKGVGVMSVYRSRPGIVLVGVVLSLVANLMFGLAIFFISSALSSATPKLVQHLFIEPLVMCSNGVPLPGGIGGMELMLNLMYRAFGSPHGIVVAFAFRISLLLVAATGGVVWMLHRSTLPTEPLPE
jgi:uncharacterized protein (TIRG00374 family)